VNSSDSEYLVFHAKAGNIAAFEALMVNEKPAILASIRKVFSPKVVRPEDLEDIYQAVQLRLWKKLPNYKTRNFKGWLKVVTRNVTVDEIRSTLAHAHVEIAGVSLDQIDPRTEEPDELIVKTREAIELLSPRETEAVTLFYHQGHKYSEIAVLMDISEGTVRTLLARARRKVKAYVTTVE